jgi:hypothetical protein
LIYYYKKNNGLFVDVGPQNTSNPILNLGLLGLLAGIRLI